MEPARELDLYRDTALGLLARHCPLNEMPKLSHCDFVFRPELRPDIERLRSTFEASLEQQIVGRNVSDRDADQPR